MSANAESPTTEPITDTVTGGATLARTWYGQVRSAFGKPHIALMSDVQDPATINHSSQPISSLIGTIPSLRFTTPARLRELADVAQRERVDVGEAIIRQGEYGDDVFFILDGTFDVLISHFGHTPDFIRVLRAGDSFGELGVLYDVPRTATVRCTSPGHILRIPGETFLDALDTGT
ncbi:MAG: cyclic nucleotide-binding domain-containing protein [Ilumatobacteraceae bacterium]|nr:cyclic nucleotide-binding domain-containing protein [Ilumatobacteraceae bacterium]